VDIGPDCVSVFQQLKLKKSYEYIIYNISGDKKHIVVEKTSTSEKHDAFIADLPETECRFAVKDFRFEIDPTEGERNKILLIVWYVVSSSILHT
jgi:cofilin